MIVLTNSTVQTVSVGQSITFTEDILHTGPGESYRKNTGMVKLRCNGIYEINFSADVSGATASTAVELTVQLGGENLPETIMISTPSAANEYNSVSTTTAVKNCCGDYDRITIVNTGTTDILVANPSLFIKRVA